MRRVFLAIAILTVGSLPALGQIPSSPPTGSAYQGTVGDWALGRWTGYKYADASFSRLATEDRVLVVSKLSDGRVACQWGTPAQVSRGGWASDCAITATMISLRTTAKSEVQLNQAGKELDGKYGDIGARLKVHMHRGDVDEATRQRQ